MTTPAEELRAAAARLRKLAGAATPGPWWRHADYPHLVLQSPVASATDADGMISTDLAVNEAQDGDFIAAMHPGVGLALASWLMAESAISAAIETTKAEYSPQGVEISVGLSTFEQALAVARALNGGQL